VASSAAAAGIEIVLGCKTVTAVEQARPKLDESDRAGGQCG